MTEPLVSAIIPAYNRRDFVAQAVESVLAQTYRAVEAVVVDDGSTDGTGDMMRERFGADPRVTYVWQKNAERAAARNTGIARSRGAYLAFLDSDDSWLPEKLERQVSALAQHPHAGLVFSGFSVIDTAGGERHDVIPAVQESTTCGNVFASLLLANVIPILTAVVRRTALERVGLFDTDRRLTTFEDWELWLRVCYRFAAFCVPEATAIYRVHSGNTWKRLTGSQYALLVRKVLAYVRPDDRRMVRAQAERFFWGLMDEAGRTRDRRASCRVFAQGLAFFGPRFAAHALRYRCRR